MTDLHAEIFRNRERPEPVRYLTQVLRRYCPTLPAVSRLREIHAPRERGTQIARAWEHSPDLSHVPLVRDAYRDLARQSDVMFRVATETLRVSVKFVPEHEPYASAAEQSRALEGRELKIAHGLGNNHPVLSPEEYDRFRAVHDMFGHAALGVGFDRHGEYQAFIAHSAMYTGLARWAMASEYRGVNSSLWAGHRRAAGKAVLLPPWLVFDHPSSPACEVPQ